MSSTIYGAINYDAPIPDLSKPFSVTCHADTDVWEKPPSTHSFSAPIIYCSLIISTFKSARVTVSADWKHKYDQGGLCLVINPESDQKKWVKTGIECLNGEPHVSTVATCVWSDWSLRPMPSTGKGVVTIEIESNEDGSLWVYVVENGKKSPMREVTWWADVDQDAECWIGVYAAKPSKETGSLEVNFKDLGIETM